jgi:hypothetical protein
MTRLTDEQIRTAWEESGYARGSNWLGTDFRAFADRIAALAVQEVELERRGVNWEANFLSERHFRKEADAKVATLTDQLAEAREQRDETRKFLDEVIAERATLRAQLATAKREGQEEMAAGLLYIWRNVPVGGDAFHELLKAIRDYQNAPATPSGEGCVRCGDTCKPWCHNATPLPAPDHSKAQSLAEQLARDTEFSGDGLYNLARAYQSVREEQVTETATDLSECERWADEIRHWVDETVPEPALALMLSALRNLEAAAGARAGADAKRIMDMAQRNI